MGYENASLMRDEVYRRLRRDILDCAIRPGADIREPEISERFAVSKSPVRDALLRLEAEGLVLVHPRRGYQVAPISVSDAADLFEFRALLEPACALNAAEHARDEDLTGLDRFRSLDAFEAASGEVAPSFVIYNRAFHLGLADLCANQRMRDAARDVIERFDRLVVVSLRETRAADQAGLIAEHIEIIDALQAREGRRAARILGGHVGRARKRVLDGLSHAAVVP